MMRDSCRQCGAQSGEGDQGVARETAPSGEVYWLCQSHYIQEMDRQRHLTPHRANNTTDLARAMWQRVTGWTQVKRLLLR
jgi:hypothetical protein